MSTSRTREKADGELFKSTGIDDNATSTAVTIDASENVMVGKTSTAFGTAGTALRGDNAGLLQSTRAGVSLELNRLSSDGNIIDLAKDGTTVGSINTRGGNLSIGSGDVSLEFNASNDALLPSSTTTNNTRDAAVDLGISSVRFKDLYLSGGVYLGGTGAANLISDYEEGTWTPAISGASVSGGSYVGHYTKIGRQVFFQWYSSAMTISSASGAAAITGLPFGSSNATQAYGVFYYQHGNAVNGGSRGGYVHINDTKMTFVSTNLISAATYVNGTNKYIMISGSYFVA